MNEFLGLKEEIAINSSYDNLKYWTLFKEICVICISSSNFFKIKENLNKVGIYNFKYFIFNTPEKVINNGPKDISFYNIISQNYCDETCKNIYNNHIYLIDKYHSKGNILIFEDDIEFSKFNNKKLEASYNFIKNNNWDIFFYGYIQYPILFSYFRNRNIVKLVNPLGMQGYCLSKQGMKKVLDFSKKINKKYPIDYLYNQIPKFKKFGVFPSIAFQSKSRGLYRTFQNKVKPFRYIEFNRISVFSEYVSLLMPILLILITLMSMYIMKKMKFIKFKSKLLKLLHETI